MPGPSASNIVFVAHQDDDILFMEQGLQSALARGEAITTVFVTAGDAGKGASYWQGREDGARAAYSAMVGSTQWVTETATIGEGDTTYQVVTSYLADHPDIRLYFLRTPDGFMQGGGSARYGRESLQRLVEGTIDRVHTVDGATSYSRDDLVQVMQLLIEEHQATNVMIQDQHSIFTREDHSDHRHVSILATMAALVADGVESLQAHVDYGSRNLPENVSPELLARISAVFQAYVEHDPAAQGDPNPDGSITFRSHFMDWLMRDYRVEDVMDIWALDFTQRRGGWRVEDHVRTLADVNGDGRADIVGFGSGQVLTATVGDMFFGKSVGWSTGYTYRSGWRVDRHEREMGDINGDGRADIIAFGDNGVQVALSDGTRFIDAGLWLANFGYVAGRWRVDQHERAIGDVNGDGRDDVIGFGGSGTLVGLSNGSGLTAAQSWTREFSYAAGWRVDTHVRTLADVDGDGRADIVGFGQHGVSVALAGNGRFAASTVWTTEFGQDTGWRVGTHERVMADVNGDGRADIVGFGDDGVVVALSNGTGFGPAQVWSDEFGFNDGFRNSRHERMVVDINGDGMADIVAFGEEFVEVALSTGTGFSAPCIPDEFAI